MNGKPTLSIITPSYNHAEFIEQTIRSVLDQNYPGLEYQVMDGGSTDGTLEILNKYSDRLYFRSHPDGGQANAINEGFRTSRGDIIGWINSDDHYLPGSFDSVCRFFSSHPTVNWIYGRCPIIDRDGRESKQWITRYKEFWQRRYSYDRLLIENFIPQPAVFFRRSLLESVGHLNTGYINAFDYHLWIRFGAKSSPSFIDQKLACFRIIQESKTSSNFTRSFREELDAARSIAAHNHPILMALHTANRYKLTGIYMLMNLIRRLQARIPSK